jgi:hypothetical protein
MVKCLVDSVGCGIKPPAKWRASERADCQNALSDGSPDVLAGVDADVLVVSDPTGVALLGDGV